MLKEQKGFLLDSANSLLEWYMFKDFEQNNYLDYNGANFTRSLFVVK